MCCSSEGSLCSSALICPHDIPESVVCQLSKLCQLSPLPRLSYGNIPVACDRLTCSLTSDPALMYVHHRGLDSNRVPLGPAVVRLSAVYERRQMLGRLEPVHLRLYLHQLHRQNLH